MNAFCIPCQHVADDKILERGCDCKCHTGVAVFPRTWIAPKGYKFGTSDKSKRNRKAAGVKGAKATKKFRRIEKLRAALYPRTTDAA